MCTALLFANLDGIQAQQHVLSRQQELAARLIDIESRRVSVDVDHPLLLTQAKLLRARARVESAALGASERKMRAALSTLLGRPLDQAGIVENSMPPLPENPTNTLEDSETLQQLLACRDLVQLDYLSEYLARLKAAHDMELAKASIGTLVAAHITEGFKFNALLQLNNQIRLAKIQFLGTTGDLEPWALGQPGPNAASPPRLQNLSPRIPRQPLPARHRVRQPRRCFPSSSLHPSRSCPLENPNNSPPSQPTVMDTRAT